MDHAAQQCYFSVSPYKITTERSDHCNPFDNVRVEGCVLICKTAAGSGAGCGLRAITGGAALGVCAQALKASEISASAGLSHLNLADTMRSITPAHESSP